MPRGRSKADAKARFLKMVNVAASGCHEWCSTLHRDGYGKRAIGAAAILRAVYDALPAGEQ